MKVLWLCNTIIPQVSNELGIPIRKIESWMVQLSDYMDQNDKIDFYVCAPFYQSNKIISIQWGLESSFYGFPVKNLKIYKYDSGLENVFQKILEKINPDIVHIFGTEFPHTLAMVKAFGNPDRTVIHIQGLVSFCSFHYLAFLSNKMVRRFTVRDFLRWDNILLQKKKFALRGKFETDAIKNVSHVMGRTDWDRACTEQIHPGIRYHHVQEMMRAPFYETGAEWKLENCEKYSIFMSQGHYPIKGLHLALEALNILRNKYPQVKLYVAGTDIIHYNSIKAKLKETYYAKYIIRLIKKWKLERNIVFTSSLDAEGMKKRYLLSHVFISPSVIENSPNSIGEAMLLGVPIVASDVGGVSSLVEHWKNGFLYQADAPYMLAYYIGKIFEDSLMTEKMSQIEKVYALELYDRNKIMRQLLDAYQIITEAALII